MNRILSVLLAAMLLSTSFGAFAQAKNQMAGGSTRRHLTVIVFAGLAGAVMGLSTLSFYGRPQEKLSNIAVGAAFGIIGGTFYSTYKAATEPRDFYGLNSQPELWRLADSTRLSNPAEYTPKAVWSFTF